MKLAEYFVKNKIGYCHAGRHIVSAKSVKLASPHGTMNEHHCPAHEDVMLAGIQDVWRDIPTGVRFDVDLPTVCYVCWDVIAKPNDKQKVVIDGRSRHFCKVCMAKLDGSTVIKTQNLDGSVLAFKKGDQIRSTHKGAQSPATWKVFKGNTVFKMPVYPLKVLSVYQPHDVPALGYVEVEQVTGCTDSDAGNPFRFLPTYYLRPMLLPWDANYYRVEKIGKH